MTRCPSIHPSVADECRSEDKRTQTAQRNDGSVANCPVDEMFGANWVAVGLEELRGKGNISRGRVVTRLEKNFFFFFPSVLTTLHSISPATTASACLICAEHRPKLHPTPTLACAIASCLGIAPFSHTTVSGQPTSQQCRTQRKSCTTGEIKIASTRNESSKNWN